LLSKEITKFDNLKHKLEDDILAKLDAKTSHDNTVRQLNKVLHEIKDSNIENELNLTRLENSYGKYLLGLEKLNSLMENDKFDLDAIKQKNLEKEKEIDKLRIEIKNYDLLFKQKERKLSVLNKKIEEVICCYFTIRETKIMDYTKFFIILIPDVILNWQRRWRSIKSENYSFGEKCR
jgi:chromosome segregation ATPase